MNFTWWYFPLALSIASPISTYLSNRYGSNLKFIISWQICYCLFLALIWGMIFYTQKNEMQARTVAFSIICPMLLDTSLIYFLNHSISLIRILGIIFCVVGLGLLFYPTK